uniref:Uncharacterized protein n=1 Tax=Amphimedon queenslandica TaxID=400682 RepID=A0A1X7TCI6_AMPQE
MKWSEKPLLQVESTDKSEISSGLLVINRSKVLPKTCVGTSINCIRSAENI